MGNATGHKQLLSYARLRAIENRRSIVRSANTGISAVINAKGEIINKLPYDTRGLLKAKFAPANKITFYTQYGNYIARWSGFIAVLFSGRHQWQIEEKTPNKTRSKPSDTFIKMTIIIVKNDFH